MNIYVYVPVVSIVASPAGRVRGERIACCADSNLERRLHMVQPPVAGGRDDCGARWPGAAGDERCSARWPGAAARRMQHAAHRGASCAAAQRKREQGRRGPAGGRGAAAHHPTGRRTKIMMRSMLHNMMRSCSFTYHANVCVCVSSRRSCSSIVHVLVSEHVVSNTLYIWGTVRRRPGPHMSSRCPA